MINSKDLVSNVMAKSFQSVVKGVAVYGVASMTMGSDGLQELLNGLLNEIKKSDLATYDCFLEGIKFFKDIKAEGK